MHLEVGLPSKTDRRAIVNACARGAAADGVADAIALHTSGCTSATVVGIYRRGALTALERCEATTSSCASGSSSSTSVGGNESSDHMHVSADGHDVTTSGGHAVDKRMVVTLNDFAGLLQKARR